MYIEVENKIYLLQLLRNRPEKHTKRSLSFLFLNIYIFIAVVIVWQFDLQIPEKSVPITTKVVSLNPVHDEMYSIQHDVIKFVSDLRQVGGFLRVLQFPPQIKLIATIQLKCVESGVRHQHPTIYSSGHDYPGEKLQISSNWCKSSSFCARSVMSDSQ